MDRWTLATATGLTLLLGTSLQAQNPVDGQVVENSRFGQTNVIGGAGPTGAGFFTQELPAGFRIQGINPPAWRVPGGTGPGGPLPKGRILRTPSSQKLMDQIEKRKKASLSRSARNRAAIRSRRPDTRSGASWDHLRERRSRQEGAKYTPQGRIAPDPTLRPREKTQGIRSARPAEPAVSGELEAVTRARQKQADRLAQWNAERAERRKLQEEALARVLAHRSQRAEAKATSERNASRRFGMSGGVAPRR
jgi:hypothetical protein